MKLGIIIPFILIASAVFFIFGVIVQDMETNYVETGIVDTDPMNQSYLIIYNSTANITSGFEGIQDDLIDLQSQDSWWDTIVDVASIPLLVLKVPIAVISTSASAIGNIYTILVSVGVNVYLIGLVTLALTIWIVIKLVNFIYSKEPI